MLLFWVIFITYVLTMLVLDLAVFHRKAHTVGFREAMRWTVLWVAQAVAFAIFVYFWRGSQPALEFVTGYLIELSLSVDNLFVFLMVFGYFKVPDKHQHTVLFWGILGALVMRAIFILTGVALIQRFHWVIYVFGAFLIYTGIKLLRSHGSEVHPERNPVLKLFRRLMPITPDYVEGKFFIRNPGLYATPLFVVLLVVETTDLMFAVDSIPAILAITRDPFIVFTSNVFAILGLRSLYFSLAGLMGMFHYLNYGLAFILMFVGAKMLMSGYFHLPIAVALGVVAGLLAASVIASVLYPKKTDLVAEAQEHVRVEPQ